MKLSLDEKMLAVALASNQE